MCRIETYASVHHLTSIVRGRIDRGVDAADLLKALFPGGSMTGAPKVRAMQAIEDLEPVRRGIYAGALGYLSFCGSIDLSMVIRTAIVAGGRTWLQVGGGVVADSDPESEYQESLDKARSVLEALEAAG
jgi:para-aminobenzoate synthetase component 1